MRQWLSSLFAYDGTVSLDLVIWALCAGLVIAVFVTYYRRAILGSFIRALIRAGADSPDTAVTLAAVGHEKNLPVRLALHSKSYRRILRVLDRSGQPCGGTEGEGGRYSPGRLPKGQRLTELSFYVAPEKKFYAEQFYRTRGNGPITAVIACLLFIAAAALSLAVFTRLIELAERLL